MSCAICSARARSSAALFRIRRASPRRRRPVREGGGRRRDGVAHVLGAGGGELAEDLGRPPRAELLVGRPTRLGRHSPPIKLATRAARGLRGPRTLQLAPFVVSSSSAATTGFVERTDPRNVDPTTWPGSSVKSGGTRPGPGEQDAAGGTGLARRATTTSSGNVRRMRAVDVSPAKSSRRRRPAMRNWISNGASQSSGRSTPGRARTRRRRSSPGGRYSGFAPSILARRRRWRSCARAASRIAEDERELRLGDVPARVAADADRLARADGRRPPASLRKSSGRSALVDERIEFGLVALLHPRVAAALVRDTRAPDFRRSMASRSRARSGDGRDGLGLGRHRVQRIVRLAKRDCPSPSSRAERDPAVRVEPNGSRGDQ